MTQQTLYLSSLESQRFESVRECRIVELLTFDTGKEAAYAFVEPPVLGQEFNKASDIRQVIVAPRHEGASIAPVHQSPCFVFIAIPRGEFDTLRSPIRADDLEIIGWGELYRTYDDAQHHSFD
ncbi:hypothetical protein [Amycolatopsis pithecellobii]|uniref:Uncharacterized protein n=1 Tax=Amycolatopsis pithecellobii TaxID=664692 RepID=A0A6N7YVX8_9PSEU|nr:hypothetical protein [Amycolatopsis pithecellobii]MTD56092.1 hypothetical protein [Amycolatopsis pithecellobii]